VAVVQFSDQFERSHVKAESIIPGNNLIEVRLEFLIEIEIGNSAPMSKIDEGSRMDLSRDPNSVVQGELGIGSVLLSGDVDWTNA
jgi:hypothetical protein